MQQWSVQVRGATKTDATNALVAALAARGAPADAATAATACQTLIPDDPGPNREFYIAASGYDEQGGTGPYFNLQCGTTPPANTGN